MKKVPLLLAFVLLALSYSPAASLQTPVCYPFGTPGEISGSVCIDEAQETPTQTETPTITPTATETATPTNTPTFTPTPNTTDLIPLQFYRNPNGGLPGTVDGGDWVFPGQALTASTISFAGSHLQGRQVVFARWVLAWNPSTGVSPTGVRLVKCDDGPTNCQPIATVLMSAYQAPRVDGATITSQIQYMIDNAEYKHIGQQTVGNGQNGCIIYSSFVEIYLR